VKHPLDESVAGGSEDGFNGHGALAENVADLAGVGVASDRGVDVAHEHDIGTARTCTVRSGHDERECVGRVRGARFALPRGSRLPPQLICQPINTVDERHSELGLQCERSSRHAELAGPMSELPRRVLLRGELFGPDRPHSSLSSAFADSPQASAPGQLEELFFATGCLGLGLRDLGSLGDRQFAGQQCVVRVGEILDGNDRLECEPCLVHRGT
jgi:hypothetical protein